MLRMITMSCYLHTSDYKTTERSKANEYENFISNADWNGWKMGAC